MRTPLEVNVDLPWPAYLPRDYVTGQRLRIEVYRRLARVRRLERLEDFRQEQFVGFDTETRPGNIVDASSPRRGQNRCSTTSCASALMVR